MIGGPDVLTANATVMQLKLQLVYLCIVVLFSYFKLA